MKKALMIFALLAICGIASGQDCYSKLRDKGIALSQKGSYSEAIKKFEGARECPDKPAPNDLDYQIGEAKRLRQEYRDELARKQREADEAERLRKQGNMVFVEGGTFQMGCDNARDADCQSDETLHSVTVSGFYIGKTEVTQAEWRKVMGSNPPKLAFPGCDDCPVERVSWDDIQSFLQKLNSQSGLKYRLPTEAEWEFAARGGKNSRGYKYSGSDNLDEVAWYTSNAGSKTHSVATKNANELGIFDMSGNVWELCADWYGSYPSGSQTNPQGPSTGSSRVFRGGGWGYSPVYCRAALRYYNSPGYRYDYLGFRLARSF